MTWPGRNFGLRLNVRLNEEDYAVLRPDAAKKMGFNVALYNSDQGPPITTVFYFTPLGYKFFASSWQIAFDDNIANFVHTSLTSFVSFKLRSYRRL